MVWDAKQIDEHSENVTEFYTLMFALKQKILDLSRFKMLVPDENITNVTFLEQDMTEQIVGKPIKSNLRQ